MVKSIRNLSPFISAIPETIEIKKDINLTYVKSFHSVYKVPKFLFVQNSRVISINWSPETLINAFNVTYLFLFLCKTVRILSALWEPSAQKMKFFIKDFFSKYDQIRRKLRIWSHLLKKSLMANVTFCAVSPPSAQRDFKLALTLTLNTSEIPFKQIIIMFLLL